VKAFEKLSREQLERALAQSMKLNKLVLHTVCPDCGAVCIQTKTGFVGAHYYPDLRDALKESKFFQCLYGESIMGYVAEQRERTPSPTTTGEK
jgi:hypothetical protein